MNDINQAKQNNNLQVKCRTDTRKLGNSLERLVIFISISSAFVCNVSLFAALELFPVYRQHAR